MKTIGHHGLTTLLVIFCIIFKGCPVLADDTCVFSVTADGLSSKTILLPDSGTDIEQVVGYTNRDYIPVAAPEQDAFKIPGSDILSGVCTFTAPVVPAAKTISGDKIYMAFFKPDARNFWEGNVSKYGILSDSRIVDVHGDSATWPDGAMRDDTVPYWSTVDWADVAKNNYIHSSSRIIYTYLTRLIRFESSNADLTAAILGNPTSNRSDIINYVRGADVFDEDRDSDVTENRSIITGDVLHSELSIFQYRYADGSSKTMVYFGANDGMLHAVLDVTESSGFSPTVTSHGTEEWAFIPPDQLPRLKELIEGIGHQIYIDATPKIYFKDIDNDGVLDSGHGDKVILVCGEGKGGTGYFALDVTDPSSPRYLWRINRFDDSGLGWAAPTTVIAELGETWSEPQFGVVKTSDEDAIGTPVFFIGGGYSSDNSSGKAVIAVNVLTGAVVKKFSIGMNYGFPSSVLVIDENDNGFLDKVYVGDLGGQMWRFSSFADSGGKSLSFPNCNENIHSWKGHVFFKADNNNSRKFFYPPTVTLEKGYDMVFMGTGNRENACCNNRNNACSFTGPDIIAAVKETHSLTTIICKTDLADFTDPGATPSDLPAGKGWYIRLVDDSGNAVGEKVLAEGTVFNKTFYITTFTPSNDPDVFGGNAKLYALSYLSGAAVLDFNDDSNLERMLNIGRGIPSKPVTQITRTGTKLLISVLGENPGTAGPSLGAEIKSIEPLLPPINLFVRFWREVFK